MEQKWVLVRIAHALAVDEERGSENRSRNVMEFAGESLDAAIIEARAWAAANNAARGESPWVMEWYDRKSGEWVHAGHPD